MKNDLGLVIHEQAYKFQFEKMTLWEETLRLYIKPKPKWCPMFLYAWAVHLVYIQSRENTQGAPPRMPPPPEPLRLIRP